MGMNLLEKTELWINGITLNNTNLTLIANAVAKVLKLNPSEVLVVDVRTEHITLDILQKDIQIESIIGKEEAILDAVSEIDGVTLLPECYIHSNGILGMICYENVNGNEMQEKVEEMVDEITRKISKRVIVFPTGFELRKGLIEDTNTPYIKEIFESRGYNVSVGEIIEDDLYDVVNKISDAVSRAFGLIITTGGVGAEDKDKMVEGVLELDPDAATPYIVKFKQGTGRHIKDGVRIAVGNIGPSLIVSLPGPNDEVQIAIEALLYGIEKFEKKDSIAKRIAEKLSYKLMKKNLDHICHKH